MSRICFRNTEGDHDNEISKVRSILEGSGTNWSSRKSSECYCGDYYVNGGLQAIDVVIDYVSFNIEDTNVFNKIISMQEDLDFQIAE